MKKVFHILKNIKIGPLDAQQLNFVKKLEKKYDYVSFSDGCFIFFQNNYSFRIKDINLLETDKDIAEIKRDTDTLVYISNKFNPEIISNSEKFKKCLIISTNYKSIYAFNENIQLNNLEHKIYTLSLNRKKNVRSIEHLHDLFDYLNQKSEIQLIYLLGKDNKIFYQAKEFATFFQLETENYKNFARDLESHNE
tara:strand:- start:496 stop:1077 length:582 start_codon:yes stop_codon:yes gene_type:complete